MKPIAGTLMFFIAMTAQAKQGAIVIHAGAGSLNRDAFTSERERLYHVTLEQSLRAGTRLSISVAARSKASEALLSVLIPAYILFLLKGIIFGRSWCSNRCFQKLLN